MKALLGGILFLALFVALPASAQVYPLPNSTTCQPGYYFVPADNLCYPPGYGYNPFYSEALAKLSMRSTSFGRKANVEDSHLLFWWSYIVIFAIRCGCEIVCRGHEGKRHHTRALTQELNGAGWSVR